MSASTILRRSSMALFAIALAPTTAWAQASDSVDATATVQPAPPTVKLSQVSEVVLGSVFSSREANRGCGYELMGDGTFIVSGSGGTGGTVGNPVARNGCGLTGNLAPSPGRVNVACSPGSLIAFNFNAGSNFREFALGSGAPFIRLGEGDAGSFGFVGQNNITCPAGGSFQIDFGVTASFGHEQTVRSGQIGQLRVAVLIL